MWDVHGLEHLLMSSEVPGNVSVSSEVSLNDLTTVSELDKTRGKSGTHPDLMQEMSKIFRIK